MEDKALIQELLFRGESNVLDYKVKQYPFSGAEEAQKSELLKDILAFANAWRSETAYILVGVKNDTLELVDLDEDIDDSRLQEFINSKTNHPVNFAYRSLDYNDTKLGLYVIPVQDRPVYVRKQFGRVMPNTVYVRRGSATVIASPSEVAKMGAAASQAKVEEVLLPEFSVKVVGLDDLGHDKLTHSYKGWMILPIEKYPMISGPNNYGDRYLNAQFNKQMAAFLQESCGKFHLSFEVSNSGSSYAEDVKLRIAVPIETGAYFKESFDLLPRPRRKIDPNESGRALGRRAFPGFTIKTVAGEHVLTFSLGKLQSGETRRTPKVYLLNALPVLKGFSVSVFSDQLRSSVKISIPVEIEFEGEELTAERLRDMA